MVAIVDESEEALEDYLFVDELKSFERVGRELEQVVDYYVDKGETEATVPMQPAWVDQSAALIDIQSKKRLRKLRQDYDEHEIDGVEYEKRLRMQFEKLNPTPKWAKLSEDSTVRSVGILATSAALIKSTVVLNPDRLDVCRVTDANQSEYSQVIPFINSGYNSISIIPSHCSSTAYRRS